MEEDPFSFRYVQTAVCMTGFTDLAFPILLLLLLLLFLSLLFLLLLLIFW